MRLHEELTHALTVALKSGDTHKTSVLRFVLAQLHNREIEKKASGQAESLGDEEVREVLQREVKKRKEAIELFRRGGRDDLARKEEEEIVVIAAYLPAPLGQKEIEAEVRTVIEAGHGDVNAVMKEAMKKLKGRAEGNVVREIVIRILGNKES